MTIKQDFKDGVEMTGGCLATALGCLFPILILAVALFVVFISAGALLGLAGAGYEWAAGLLS